MAALAKDPLPLRLGGKVPSVDIACAAGKASKQFFEAPEPIVRISTMVALSPHKVSRNKAHPENTAGVVSAWLFVIEYGADAVERVCSL